MGSHLPRHQDEHTAYRLRQECFQGERLLRPDGRLNEMVTRQLERWRQVFGIVIYAYCVVESEMEIIVLCPNKNRADFTCNLYREVARRTNRLRHRTDTVFPRPYQPEALLDDEAILDAVVEVLCLPVERGLVTHPERWPGLVSLPPHPDDTSKQVWRARVCGHGELVTIGTELPPGLQELEEDDAHRQLWDAVEARRVRLRLEQLVHRQKVPTRRALLSRSPRSKRAGHRRMLPLCRASTPEDEERWIARYLRRVKAHKRTGRSYLKAEALPPWWPRGMHPPGWHAVAEAYMPAEEVA